jgi:hypothetical protein
MHYPDNLARWAQRVLGRIEAQGISPMSISGGRRAALGATASGLELVRETGIVNEELRLFSGRRSPCG